MYQPQLEAWNGDELRAYAALAVMSTTNKTTKYGVVWFTARTEVDKVNRQVTLDNFQITKVKFPMMKTKEAEYQAFLQAKLPGKVQGDSTRPPGSRVGGERFGASRGRGVAREQ